MTKKLANYRIDEEVLEAFNKKAEDNAINKSKWVENKMKEYLEEVAK